jgi:pyrophosphatase PpaX
MLGSRGGYAVLGRYDTKRTRHVRPEAPAATALDARIARMPAQPTPAPPSSAEERAARIEAVLFDLDGTLIDTVALILSSFRYATERVLGEVLPDEELMRNVGVPLARQMREFSHAHAEELLTVYRQHNAAHHDHAVREYPGTEEVLERLKADGVPMGVVTSKGAPMAWRGLRLFRLQRFFPVVVTADDVDRHKPDPDPVVHAAEALGVDVTRCAYVGDSPHDMQAAISAGAVSVAALWGAFSAAEVLAPGPDFALEAITDLPALIGGHARRFVCE